MAGAIARKTEERVVAAGMEGRPKRWKRAEAALGSAGAEGRPKRWKGAEDPVAAGGADGRLKRWQGAEKPFGAGGTEGRLKRCTARGFTLIELLVVLVIAGVMVAAVAFSVGGGAARELERTAERSARLVRLACERAEISGRDIGFAPLRERLVFGYFEAQGWMPLGPRGQDELRARPWGEAIELVAVQDGQALDLDETPPERPPFACLASGELTPFTWEFSRGDLRERWRLEGALDGTLTLTRADDAR